MTRVITAAMLAVLVARIAAAQAPAAVEFAPAYFDRAGGLTLESAIQQALRASPLLTAAHAESDAAAARQAQAALKANPSVVFEQRGQPSGSDRMTMAQVMWPLELFRRAPRAALASGEADVVKLTSDDTRRRVIGEVRARYGDAAAAIRALTIADRAVASTTEQLTLTRQRVAEGAVPAIEAGQIEVELRRIEAERLMQKGAADVAVVALAESMGANAAEPLRLATTLDELLAAAPVPEAPSEPSAVRRGDLAAADARVRVAELRIAEAAARGRVDVTLFGSYTRMDNSFPQRGFDASGAVVPVRGVFHDVSAGATLVVPLRNRNQGEIAAAHAERRAAESRRASIGLAVSGEIATAQAEYRAASEALRLTNAAVVLARNNLDVVRQAYDLGRSTLNDVLAEQRRYLEVESANIGTMKALYDARASLALAQGEQ